MLLVIGEVQLVAFACRAYHKYHDNRLEPVYTNYVRIAFILVTWRFRMIPGRWGGPIGPGFCNQFTRDKAFEGVEKTRMQDYSNMQTLFNMTNEGF